jgi:hypothetical protein
MQRARRVASVAVAASLAVVGLSACRSSPQVAAYIGKDRITENRVDAVLDDARAKTAAGAQGAAIKRQDVVDTLIGLDVLQEIAAKRNVTATAVAPADVAQAVGLRADAQYVTLNAQYRGFISAISTAATAATPTTADLRDVYDRLTKGGANPTNQSFQAFSSGISSQDAQTLAQTIGIRNYLQPEIAKLNTVVNPKYTSPELTLVSTQGSQGETIPLVVLSLAPSQGDPAVVDAS